MWAQDLECAFVPGLQVSGTDHARRNVRVITCVLPFPDHGFEQSSYITARASDSKVDPQDVSRIFDLVKTISTTTASIYIYIYIERDVWSVCVYIYIYICVVCVCVRAVHPMASISKFIYSIVPNRTSSLRCLSYLMVPHRVWLLLGVSATVGPLAQFANFAWAGSKCSSEVT